MRFIYSLFVYALLPWAFCHLLWRARRQPEYLRHWGERLGYFQRLAVKPPLIWLHAVSVGETRAAQPLIAALRLRYPQHQILLTHMTPTGRATSGELFGDSVLRCYLPYDTGFAVQRFLKHFQPKFGLILETELWPNLIAICRQQKLPLLLINARLSERSANRYALLPSLSREALQGLAAIAAISSADKYRLNRIAAGNDSLITVTGNIKFDISAPQAQIDLATSIRASIAARPVLLAASTRDGEEALILDAWLTATKTNSPVGANKTTAAKTTDDTTAQQEGARQNPARFAADAPQGGRAKDALFAVADDHALLLDAAPTPLLIIVPRHPQRFNEVAALINSRGLNMKRRSEDEPVSLSTDVLLGDSMGEMFAWYAAADVAFIGGSLLDYGSQNLIEACAVGTPVLLGPSTHNFAEAASEALACGAARRIGDAKDLVMLGLALLKDMPARTSMTEAGLAFSLRHRGATARTMELIARVVGD